MILLKMNAAEILVKETEGEPVEYTSYNLCYKCYL